MILVLVLSFSNTVSYGEIMTMPLPRFFSSCHPLFFLAQLKFFSRSVSPGVDWRNITPCSTAAQCQGFGPRRSTVTHFSCLHMYVGKMINQGQPLLIITSHEVYEYLTAQHTRFLFKLSSKFSFWNMLICIYLMKSVRNSIQERNQRTKIKIHASG